MISKRTVAALRLRPGVYQHLHHHNRLCNTQLKNWVLIIPWYNILSANGENAGLLLLSLGVVVLLALKSHHASH